MTTSGASDAPTGPGATPATSAAGDGAAAPISRKRRIAIQVLIWVTTVLAVVAIFSVWANRQLFNPDNWADTSTKLLRSEKIRTATSNYLVDQLYANVDVAGELRARLPQQLQPLAAPAAGALQNAAVAAAQRSLANARVQQIWRQANRAADRSFIDVVNGRKGAALQSENGEVTLDLSPIITNVTNRLGLPDVSSKLPPTAGHLTILKSDQLEAVQKGGKALRHLALFLTIIVPLLYALAILLARGRRRRTLMTVGIAIVAAGLLVLAGRSILESQLASALVKSEANLPAGKEIISIATGMLSEIAGAFVIVGIPLILAAWFAGPARLATKARRAIAPFLRDQPVGTFAIVGTIMVLIFIWRPIPATGRPAGIIVFLVLAFVGTEVLRRQTAREFPEGPAQTAS